MEALVCYRSRDDIMKAALMLWSALLYSRGTMDKMINFEFVHVVRSWHFPNPSSDYYTNDVAIGYWRAKRI